MEDLVLRGRVGEEEDDYNADFEDPEPPASGLDSARRGSLMEGPSARRTTLGNSLKNKPVLEEEEWPTSSEESGITATDSSEEDDEDDDDPSGLTTDLSSRVSDKQLQPTSLASPSVDFETPVPSTMPSAEAGKSWPPGFPLLDSDSVVIRPTTVIETPVSAPKSRSVSVKSSDTSDEFDSDSDGDQTVDAESSDSGTTSSSWDSDDPDTGGEEFDTSVLGIDLLGLSTGQSKKKDLTWDSVVTEAKKKNQRSIKVVYAYASAKLVSSDIHTHSGRQFVDNEDMDRLIEDLKEATKRERGPEDVQTGPEVEVFSRLQRQSQKMLGHYRRQEWKQYYASLQVALELVMNHPSKSLALYNVLESILHVTLEVCRKDGSEELFRQCVEILRRHFDFEWHVKLFELVVNCHSDGNQAQKSITGILNILEKCEKHLSRLLSMNLAHPELFVEGDKEETTVFTAPLYRSATFDRESTLRGDGDMSAIEDYAGYESASTMVPRSRGLLFDIPKKGPAPLMQRNRYQWLHLAIQAMIALDLYLANYSPLDHSILTGAAAYEIDDLAFDYAGGKHSRRQPNRRARAQRHHRRSNRSGLSKNTSLSSAAGTTVLNTSMSSASHFKLADIQDDSQGSKSVTMRKQSSARRRYVGQGFGDRKFRAQVCRDSGLRVQIMQMLYSKLNDTGVSWVRARLSWVIAHSLLYHEKNLPGSEIYLIESLMLLTRMRSHESRTLSPWVRGFDFTFGLNPMSTELATLAMIDYSDVLLESNNYSSSIEILECAIYILEQRGWEHRANKIKRKLCIKCAEHGDYGRAIQYLEFTVGTLLIEDGLNNHHPNPADPQSQSGPQMMGSHQPRKVTDINNMNNNIINNNNHNNNNNKSIQQPLAAVKQPRKKSSRSRLMKEAALQTRGTRVIFNLTEYVYLKDLISSVHLKKQVDFHRAEEALIEALQQIWVRILRKNDSLHQSPSTFYNTAGSSTTSTPMSGEHFGKKPSKLRSRLDQTTLEDLFSEDGRGVFVQSDERAALGNLCLLLANLYVEGDKLEMAERILCALMDRNVFSKSSSRYIEIHIQLARVYFRDAKYEAAYDLLSQLTTGGFASAATSTSQNRYPRRRKKKKAEMRGDSSVETERLFLSAARTSLKNSLPFLEFFVVVKMKCGKFSEALSMVNDALDKTIPEEAFADIARFNYLKGRLIQAQTWRAIHDVLNGKKEGHTLSNMVSATVAAIKSPGKGVTPSAAGHHSRPRHARKSSMSSGFRRITDRFLTTPRSMTQTMGQLDNRFHSRNDSKGAQSGGNNAGGGSNYGGRLSQASQELYSGPCVAQAWEAFRNTIDFKMHNPLLRTKAYLEYAHTVLELLMSYVMVPKHSHLLNSDQIKMARADFVDVDIKAVNYTRDDVIEFVTRNFRVAIGNVEDMDLDSTEEDYLDMLECVNTALFGTNNALECSVSMLHPELLLKSYTACSEFKLIQDLRLESQKYWIQAISVLFNMYCESNDWLFLRRRNRHFRNEIFGVFKRLVRLLMCYPPKFVSNHLYVLDAYLSFKSFAFASEDYCNSKDSHSVSNAAAGSSATSAAAAAGGVTAANGGDGGPNVATPDGTLAPAGGPGGLGFPADEQRLKPGGPSAFGDRQTSESMSTTVDKYPRSSHTFGMEDFDSKETVPLVKEGEKKAPMVEVVVDRDASGAPIANDLGPDGLGRRRVRQLVTGTVQSRATAGDALRHPLKLPGHFYPFRIPKKHPEILNRDEDAPEHKIEYLLSTLFRMHWQMHRDDSTGRNDLNHSVTLETILTCVAELRGRSQEKHQLLSGLRNAFGKNWSVNRLYVIHLDSFIFTFHPDSYSKLSVLVNDYVPNGMQIANKYAFPRTILVSQLLERLYTMDLGTHSHTGKNHERQASKIAEGLKISAANAVIHQMSTGIEERIDSPLGDIKEHPMESKQQPLLEIKSDQSGSESTSSAAFTDGELEESDGNGSDDEGPPPVVAKVLSIDRAFGAASRRGSKINERSRLSDKKHIRSQSGDKRANFAAGLSRRDISESLAKGIDTEAKRRELIVKELALPFLNPDCLNELLCCLDVQNIITVASALLNECQIVFCSVSRARVEAMIDALFALIYPFHFQGLCIPWLDPALTDMLKTKQFPIVIGVAELSCFDIPRRCVVVKCDTNAVLLAPSVILRSNCRRAGHFVGLPPTLSSKMSRALNKVAATLLRWEYVSCIRKNESREVEYQKLLFTRIQTRNQGANITVSHRWTHPPRRSRRISMLTAQMSAGVPSREISPQKMRDYVSSLPNTYPATDIFSTMERSCLNSPYSYCVSAMNDCSLWYDHRLLSIDYQSSRVNSKLQRSVIESQKQLCYLWSEALSHYRLFLKPDTAQLIADDSEYAKRIRNNVQAYCRSEEMLFLKHFCDSRMFRCFLDNRLSVTESGLLDSTMFDALVSHRLDWLRHSKQTWNGKQMMKVTLTRALWNSGGVETVSEADNQAREMHDELCSVEMDMDVAKRLHCDLMVTSQGHSSLFGLWKSATKTRIDLQKLQFVIEHEATQNQLHPFLDPGWCTEYGLFYQIKLVNIKNSELYLKLSCQDYETCVRWRYYLTVFQTCRLDLRDRGNTLRIRHG